MRIRELLSQPLFRLPRRERPVREPYFDRLVILSHRANSTGRKLCAWMPVCAVLALLVMAALLAGIWGAIGSFLFNNVIGNQGPGGVFFTSTLLLVYSIGILSTIFRLGWVVARGGGLYWSQYDLMSSYLLHTDLGAVMADEEQWAILYRNLNKGLGTLFNPRGHEKSVIGHLQNAACMRLALIDLLGGVSSLRWCMLARGVIMRAQLRRMRILWFIPIIMLIPFLMLGQSLGHIGGMPGIWSYLPLGIPLLAWLFVPIITVAQQGPELARYHATVAAFCDYLLDQPHAEISKLGPPVPRLHPVTRQWWEFEEQVRRLFRGAPQ